VDGGQLPPEKRQTRADLIGLRVAVVRWAAFDDVANVTASRVKFIAVMILVSN
jgi:hypothetical protein